MSASPAPDRWDDARRLEAFAGEARVNLIRAVALAGFYGHHLVNVFLLRDEPELAGPYHAQVTWLVLAWGCAVLVLHLCLTWRRVPPALKYVATTWDLCLVTAVLMTGRDPHTMLFVFYFLVVAAAALRLDLALVWFATLGAMLAYLGFMGWVRWVAEIPESERLPRAQQVVVLLALGAAGLLAGQAVRQARRLLQGYPVVVEGESGGTP